MLGRKSVAPLAMVMAGLILTACGDSDSDKTDAQQAAKSSEAQASAATVPTVSNEQLPQLYAQAKQVLFEHRPLSATLYGLQQEDTGYYHNNQLESFTPEAEQQLREKLRKLSMDIKQASSEGMSPEQRDDQRVMANIIRYYAGHQDFPVGYIDVWMGLSPFIVNQINGPLIDTPRTMQSDQAITDEQQALDYIARLANFDEFVGSVEAKFKADIARDWVPPKVVLKGAVRYFDNFLAPVPSEHPLVENFIAKVSRIESIPQDKRDALIAEAKRQVEEVVYPAYQSIAELTRKQLDSARDDAGIWAQPNGAAYYQDAIQQLGDSELSAEVIHQKGLDEVARISKEMDAILRPLGYKKGSVGARMAQLNEESRFLYEDSEQGRAQLLADLNGYIAEINEKMAPLFRTKPPYEVEVRAFPKDIQDGAPGGQYTPPAVDGSKPGIYWINLRDMKANPKFSLKTLTYHEANPGHHWQVALNLAQDDLPFLRRIAPYNAYVEGWALYSELVAKEIGLYEQDPFSDLGRLQAELFRAVRLVVDTGLHHKRWTREQAIEYMAETTGTARSDVVAEIERYMAWPGQALGYKMGMLKILELRDQAKKELGDKFDLAEFHDLVLLGGAVPMLVLEDKVQRWVAEKSQ
ncbi:DUF885 domain-containing protein [Pleionea litopenaei]|uniref:DUF885 domain-containing protein n=1 Tax=Pleionea litopenaei TaxID=3070815 RepID=A0AA51X8B9_9GAMM|nr:DUF885 domain-containing protein [Pleionea sp. HL-JVS1]WMS89138.1 DUF885 domain-containing protein [Pleionea sp. HL-JVS1]